MSRGSPPSKEHLLEIVNLTRGEEFVRAGRHFDRLKGKHGPSWDKAARRVDMCHKIMDRIRSAPVIDEATRLSMGFGPAMDYRAAMSSANVSKGIGAFLSEGTRVYGSIYEQAPKELRAALFADTAVAFDIGAAFPSFMIAMAPHACARLTDARDKKDAVRQAVGLALACSTDEAKDGRD